MITDQQFWQIRSFLQQWIAFGFVPDLPNENIMWNPTEILSGQNIYSEL